MHHSCGDRHCPQCSGRKRYDFAERAEKLVLKKVIYYQVVFTLPSELSEMALANREAIADLLFTTAWKSLRKTIGEEQDYDPAAMMVLHTWNQRLEPHWHVHALVPGAGPSLSGDHWKEALSPADAINSDGFHLVRAVTLRETFRKLAISTLKRLYKSGKLKLGGKFAHLQDKDAWKSFCDKLQSVQWVSFIQPPPSKRCSAEQVIRYLTRYLTGGPISDQRITAADMKAVTFMAREGTLVGGERTQVPVILSTVEFIRRWSDHIQPDQLTKTRYFGGWTSQKRTKYLQRCHRLLGPSIEESPPEDAAAASTTDSTALVTLSDNPAIKCPHCDQPSLRLVSVIAKPSWDKLLNHLHEDCPAWYAETDLEEFTRYLQDAYGIEYADWHAQCAVESAMKTPTPTPRHHQRFLPGLHPQRDFVIDSY